MDILKLRAVLGLDKSNFEKGMRETEDEASSFGSKLSGLVGGAAKGFAVVGTAAGVATTAVGAMAKQAVSSYAETQQLTGGVETLFGASAQKVLDDADKAFQTAGMSASQYMETSIQSAASLINSLGGDQAKAAELMNTSIVDMSDNVNKMGTTMEGVQNAYRGFSRGNFTMLDNLALGYSGTKEGMQELLDKAKELEEQQGRTRDFSIDSYADIVEAIHVVQTEMGISGTTAAEAAGTVSGSVGSVKAAWDNLVAGLADPDADIGRLIQNVVDSAKTALNNVLPAFKQALSGISTLIHEIVPVISAELPGIVQDVAPSVISAVADVIAAVITALPTLLNVIVSMIPQLMKTIGTAIADAWPQIQQAIMEGLGTTEGKIVGGVLAAWGAIKAIGIVSAIGSAVSAIGAIIPLLANPITLIVAAVVAAAVAIIMNWDKIKAAWGAAVEFFKGVWSGIKDVFKNVGTWIADKFTSAWDKIKNVWQSVTGFFSDIKDKIVNAFTNLDEKFMEVGRNLLTGLWNGIKEKANSVIEGVKGIGSSILSGINAVFGNASPSKEFKKIGGYLMQGLANGITDSLSTVEDAMDDLDSMMYSEVPSTDLVTDTATTTTAYGESGDTFKVAKTNENKNLTVILQLDRTNLAKAVYQLNSDETQRVGVKLAGGYA